MVMIMVDTVYSIGYSGFSIDDFIDIIKKNEISLIVDVRSQPYSKYFLEYNKESLKKSLKYNGIYYRNYAKEFGARQEEMEFYSDDGYLDFELFAKSKNFLRGFEKLKQSMLQNYKFSLMCAEKNPINCHRTILIAREFYNAGYKIIHLLPNGTMTQEDIEKCMLEMYFPDREQIKLFDKHLSNAEYISKAYKKRNAEIGYCME